MTHTFRVKKKFSICQSHFLLNLCSLWVAWQVDQCFQEGERKISKLWQVMTQKYGKNSEF